MTPLSIAAVAETMQIEPATLRYHLRKMNCFQKLGRQYLITSDDLPAIQRFIESARKSYGFQPGNKVAAKA